MKDEDIARDVHEHNRTGLQAILRDDAPSQPWDCELPWIKAKTIEAVGVIRKAIADREDRDVTCRQLHESWVTWRKSLGWKYGKEKDYIRKTHPCIMPWENLPEAQKAKTELMYDVVARLSGI